MAKYFIGGLAKNVSDQVVYDYFSMFGDISDIIVMPGKGFGFVTYSGPHTLVASEERHQVGESSAVQVKEAIPQDQMAPGSRIQATTGPSRVSRGPRGHFGSDPNTEKFFVGGLPPGTNEHDLRASFRHFGNIIDAVSMLGKGFGFVTFSHPHSCFESSTAHVVNDVVVSVKKAVPEGQAPPPGRGPKSGYGVPEIGSNETKFFIGGVGQDLLVSELRAAFEHCGTITDVCVMGNRGFGFVTFQEPHSCYASDTDFIVRGRAVSVKEAAPPGVAPPPAAEKLKPSIEAPPGQKFFIGGMAKDCTDQDLIDAFARFGTIVDVVSMYGRGFGFVTFDGPHSLYPSPNEHTVRGDRVSVKEAQPEEEMSRTAPRSAPPRAYMAASAPPAYPRAPSRQYPQLRATGPPARQVGARPSPPPYRAPGPSYQPAGAGAEKFFVGIGRDSRIDQRSFEDYFAPFGMITDIVMMPEKGIGFVTLNQPHTLKPSEDSHFINGIRVSVKHAVPPGAVGPTQSLKRGPPSTGFPSQSKFQRRF
eukprot:NODE_1291_length_1794_cov_10.828845_g1226_i0.p1 GENE.NODE_1291_length_1794_cov_10.828845_g1226_i0~~NODE_1291_length_1794_cov_10.828845_g1226_i0.p1  ORF type:complete len:531 (-),score=77.22 NODE_1291_length_1794_cov_10.828845_g1226_i0:167-1759(-)